MVRFRTIFAKNGRKDMAVLKIMNDIQDERQKNEARLWGEVEGVCYKDIDEFCENIPDDDPDIDIRLHCDGGQVFEGWAMYDRLRATGKNISVTVEGNAASMATVIMMAAPKERRYAYESAQICVHNPWMCTWWLPEKLNADDLQGYADKLRSQQQKMVDLYVERCGCKAEDIQALMDEDKYISAEQAKNIGLIGSIIPPVSARKESPMSAQRQHTSITKNKSNMAEKNVQVKESFVNKLLQFFNKKSLADITFGMDLNTSDGQVLTIEREEGAPEVGDKASPDGEFVMPDGSTIVVADGVITEIRQANTDGEGAQGAEGDGQTDDKDARIAELEQQLADRDAEIAKLKEQLATANTNAKSVDDLRILNAVKIAGGEKALAKLTSSYKPQQRQPSGKKAEERSARAQMTSDIVEAVKKMRK